MHDNKTKADLEILRAEAAQSYWETHNFDPVRAHFYDPEKEKDYAV